MVSQPIPTITVVEPITETALDQICEASVELVENLVAIMQRRGLSREHASSILAVAAAGVNKFAPVTHEDFAAGVDMASPLWKGEVKDGQAGVTFTGIPLPRTKTADLTRSAPTGN